MEEIKALLDQHGIWTDNPDIVQRVRFALELLERKSDELSNIHLGLTTACSRPTKQQEREAYYKSLGFVKVDLESQIVGG